MPAEPDRIALFDNAHPGRATTEAMERAGVFGVLRDRVLYIYQFADRAAAKAYHAALSDFVSWYDDPGGNLSWAVTSSDRGLIGSGAIARPQSVLDRVADSFFYSYLDFASPDAVGSGLLYKAWQKTPTGNVRACISDNPARAMLGHYDTPCVITGSRGCNVSSDPDNLISADHAADAGLTVAAWLNLGSPSGPTTDNHDGECYLFSSLTHATRYWGIRFHGNIGARALQGLFVQSPGGWYKDGSSGAGAWQDLNEVDINPFFDGKWHHWCFTFDKVGGALKLYIDGVLRHTWAGTPGIGIAWAPQIYCTSAQVSGGGDFTAHAGVSDWGGWNRVLTPAEVAGLAA